jgi:aminopeptidase-like protein
MTNQGKKIYSLAESLYPICRSITGEGVRKTLKIIKSLVPEMRILEVPSGTKCFDWQVPLEWNIHDAYIKDPNGKKIVDFKKNNLHVVSYSDAVNRKISLADLDKHLYAIPELPDAIPYITSYYDRNWGFCISHNQRKSLPDGLYQVCIDSTLKSGSLTYGEIILPGKDKEEVFLSTYICHPSMGNNELSGPCVTTYLAKWLSELPSRRFTYRIIFIPETIGSIVYLSRNIKKMKKRIIAGYNITCIGDNLQYSYLPSRNESSLSDRVARHVLTHTDENYITYPFSERGSDERQYCWPGVDLPIASIMRTKYQEYPQYHTSADDLNFICPQGLYGGYKVLKRAIEAIECNYKYKSTCLCEPQLGKRKLYSLPGTHGEGSVIGNFSGRDILNILTYCDGDHDLLSIADKLNQPIWKIFDLIEVLSFHKLLKTLK